MAFSKSLQVTLLAVVLFIQYASAATQYYWSAVDYQKNNLFPATGKGALTYAQQIADFSMGVEQTLNIGSQSSGAGAGKVTFNPVSITRNSDAQSPVLFQRSAAGTPFQLVTVYAVRSPDQGVVMQWNFGLTAIKTISYGFDESGSPKETLSFEYGALELSFAPTTPQGTLDKPVTKGWNRVQNVLCSGSSCQPVSRRR